jgi:hypothetical protein
MTKNTLTEKELADAQCTDFSIQTMPNGLDGLILMCKGKEISAKLMEILRNNAFNLGVSIDEKTDNYSLEFHFIDSDLALRFDTGRNEGDYPPLAKLKNRQIRFITTGMWTGRSSQGRSCIYDPNVMRLGLFDIGDSFKQAKEVQFVPGETDKEPSVVILVYDDYNHIYSAEADEGYNRLMAMAKMRPLLEIKLISSNRINLRIWDILIDLDIRFDGLQFSEAQLSNFLAKTDVNDPFAFVLGLPTRDGERAAIASTKSEGFELITLAGYVYKK